MAYLTVKGSAESKFVEKKSEFIGYVKRVENEDEAKKFIEDIKNIHKQATHNVYAYVLGKNKDIQRYSDDGEPQGTAGIPILEIIKKTKISDCVIVVTRYFGGILLGASGLIRAYSKAASEAVENAGIVEKVNGIKIEVIIDYDMLGKFQYMCEQNKWHIENIIYEDKVKMLFNFETDKKESFKQKIINITQGKSIIEEYEQKEFFKLGNRLFENV